MTNNNSAMRGVAIFGVAATVMSCILSAASPVARALHKGDPLLGIVLGTDGVDLARHSDTLMVWRYDPAAQKVDVLSVPRDTKIHLPGYRFNRINEVYAYHYGDTRDIARACFEVMDAVKFQLSFPGTLFAPQYFIHVDYGAFTRFIDILGGVDIHIDEPMHYDDKAGNYHFHKDPGDHHMDGETALGYVRFRGKSGDRGRILRQMEFLKALAAKATSPVVAFRFPQLLGAVFAGFHTNFRFWDIFCLAWESKHINPETVNPWLLPGQPKGAYWDINKERAALVVKQILGIPTADTQVPVGTALGAGAVTVKVWNATRKGGLALDITRLLRANNFDVVEWGTTPLRQTKTRVVDRSGRIGHARQVAEVLHVETVFSEVNPQTRVDVEVFLGDDSLGLVKNQ
jgi:LCP family protein required for cell wall assembly